MRVILMRYVTKVLLAIYVSLLLSTAAWACIWDEDTLAMEQQEFPGTLELITGKFLRHSPEFYAWRAKDREQRLKTESKPGLYDDLAVAQDKLGQHEKAIALMEEKEKLFPGKYETRANLGTFYIHSGQLERGVKEIEAAIEINPDAHFGREVYQLLLVKYLISKQVEGKTTLPLEIETEGSGYYARGFAKYILEQAEAIRESEKSDTKLESHSQEPAKEQMNWQQQELQLAVKGVLGMMRFGNFDSPILLEALGDLLNKQGAHHLAARAYLKASYEVEDEATQQAYREIAKFSLQMQRMPGESEQRSALEVLESQFKQELAQAATWHQEVSSDENQWIAKNLDVDAAFAKKYYSKPVIQPVESPAVRERNALANKRFAIFIGSILAVPLLICGLVFWYKRSTAPRMPAN